MHGPDLERLRLLLQNIFPDRDVILCGSGSFALELALRAGGVEPGDEVVVPTFCCSAIMLPIVALGATAVFADCGEDLNISPESAALALTNKTKAIVAAHLFGNPTDIRNIVALANGRDISVIDDAAQALGAEIDSQPVGGFGDAGILSFGVEKVVAGIGGGALLVPKNRNLRLQTDFASPKSGRVVRSFFSTFLKRRWRRLTHPLNPIFGDVIAIDPELPPRAYRNEALANLNAAIAATILERLEADLAARRECCEAYQELLGSDEKLQLISHRSDSACLSQVLRIFPQRNGEDLAARLIVVLGRAGYDIQGSYIPIHLLAPFRQFARKRLRYAENVWPDLIELPCEPGVSLADVRRIAAIVRHIVCGAAG